MVLKSPSLVSYRSQGFIVLKPQARCGLYPERDYILDEEMNHKHTKEKVKSQSS